MLYAAARKQPQIFLELLSLLSQDRLEKSSRVTAPTQILAAMPSLNICEATASPVKRLWHDFETQSIVNIKKAGTHVYATDTSTKPLMLAYAFDEEPVRILDFTSAFAGIPDDLWKALNSPTTQKIAWNATFERLIWKKIPGVIDNINEWFDPSILAKYLTFPAPLKDCCRALHIAKGKDAAGNKLVKMFSCPTKSSKTKMAKGAPPTYFKDATTHPEQWQQFLDYCVQDVDAMRTATNLLETYSPLPASEQKLWQLDQKINATGIPVDLSFVVNADCLMRAADANTLIKLKELTGCANPNSDTQIKKWLAEQQYPMASLAAGVVDMLLANVPDSMPDQVKTALGLRKALAGAGPKKLTSIQNSISADGRLRYQHNFNGSRTGRWSGRDVQIQNLPKPSKELAKRVDEITTAILEKRVPSDLDVAEAITGTIRSSFRSAYGSFVISDYSMIEVRVLAWLAKCKGMLDIFASDGDVYKSFAALMLRKPVSEVTKAERNMAKAPVLGCGYGMGADRLRDSALSYGVEMTRETGESLVDLFRTTYSEIKLFWRGCQEAAILALENRTEAVEYDYLVFDGTDPRCLRIKLPSGRYLTYRDAEIALVSTDWGERQSIRYSDSYQTAYTHGTKLTENVTQAVARDVLADGLVLADKAGVQIVAHVHDEIIAESQEHQDPEVVRSLLTKAMSHTPEWAPGLVIVAEGFISSYYKKG